MSEWKQAPLGDLVKIQKGKLSIHADFPMDGYLPVINTETIAGKITVWGEPIGSVLCDENDLLLLWDGERSGLVAIGFRGIVGSTFSKLTVKSDVESNYLYHQLQNKFSWIQQQRTGTGVPHVPKNLNIILNIDFPTSIPEQLKIARILSTVDAVIEKTEAAIDKYKNIKAGMMRDLFTRGIDLVTGKLRASYEEAPELYKQSELGWVPKEWEVVRIGDCCDLKRGASPRPIDDPKYFSHEGRGWVRISDVTSSYKYLEKTVQKLSPIGASASVKIEINELIMSICATIGRPIIVRTPVCIHDGFVYFKDIQNVFNTEFAFYYLLMNEQKISENKQIGTQGNLNTGIVNNIPIVNPNPSEQDIIVCKITALDRVIEIENQNLTKSKQLKQALMSDLLTGKVRVKYEEEKEEEL